MWELHEVIHNRKKERGEKETEIKRSSGSFLISQWKQEKQKLNEM